jgi:rhodanese-related sulfurtransferase
MAESVRELSRPLRLLASAGQQSVAGVLIGSLAILIASAAAGLIANRFSPRGLPLFPRVRAQETVSLPLPPGLKSMGPREADTAFQAQSALFVDARAPEEYAEGHIPGALNIPPDDFENRVLDNIDRIEGAPAIIAYCPSIECWDAVEIAERLREVTDRPIYVFEQGWAAWRSADYPVTTGDQP